MDLSEFIRLALEEDLGDGDHTTMACVPADARGRAKLLVKEKGILAGVSIARAIFTHVEPAATMEVLINDGTEVQPGDIAFYIHGSDRMLLSTERLVLNIMQRMSGIATQTRRIIKMVEGTGVRLLDTRKTTPLMRFLEKEAVKTGGGSNHRFGLYDMVMIKDNHVDFAGGIAPAIRKVNAYLLAEQKKLKIEIEVRNMRELEEVLAEGNVHRIMLDNFMPHDISNAVKLIGGRYETEASGGITEQNIADYAGTGVDYISVGALTHSVKSLDLSLKADTGNH